MPIDFDATVLASTLAVFGESITYFPASGGAYALLGVFDEPYKDAAQLDALEANAVLPTVGIRLSQLPVTPQVNDEVRITARGRVYVIRDVRPDSHGWAKLLLGDETPV